MITRAGVTTKLKKEMGNTIRTLIEFSFIYRSRLSTASFDVGGRNSGRDFSEYLSPLATESSVLSKRNGAIHTAPASHFAVSSHIDKPTNNPIASKVSTMARIDTSPFSADSLVA
jgi:hypothetical protein